MFENFSEEIISAPYPPAVEEIVEEHIAAEPCAPVEPAPEPIRVVAPAPIPVVPAPAPAPVEIVPQQLVQVVRNPAPVVIDAPYPAALPIPSHYGGPVLPLKYLLLNNAI